MHYTQESRDLVVEYIFQISAVTETGIRASRVNPLYFISLIVPLHPSNKIYIKLNFKG